MKKLLFSFAACCAILTPSAVRTAPELTESQKSEAKFMALTMTAMDVASALFVAPWAYREMTAYTLSIGAPFILSSGLKIAAGVGAAFGYSEGYRHFLLAFGSDSINREVVRANREQRNFVVSYALLGCILATFYTFLTR